MADLTNQLQAAAGSAGAAALELYAWGENTFGAVGNDTSATYYYPQEIGGSDWSVVSGGVFYATAIKNDGTLWAWGANDVGQLGDGTIINKSSPIQIGALSDWAQVSSGQAHALAIKTNGTLWSWGGNGSGQLGGNNTNNASSPVQVGALSTWAQIAAGFSFSMAIKTDGTLWGWGTAGSGVLGNSNESTNRSSPIQIGALTNWSKVVARNNNCVAVKTDGTLWSWGFNGNGKLGINSTINQSSPVQIGSLTDWSSISIGAATGFAIKTNGTIWSWGSGSNGISGQNSVDQRSSPTQIGALSDWAQVSAFGSEAAFAIKTDGTLWGWGDGRFAALGQNVAVQRSSPIQIGSLSNWLQVDAGSTSGYAITTTDELYSWGVGTAGQLGLNQGNILSPVLVGSQAEWTQVAISDGTEEHTIGLKSDGTLWGWGVGRSGQLGIGLIDSGPPGQAVTPVQIGSDANWSYVGAGQTASGAIKTDGTLWTWGLGTDGVGGRNNTTTVFSPVQVGSLTNWLKIKFSSLTSCYALKTDGTLWGWGHNSQGELGLGNTTFISSPVQIGAANYSNFSTGFQYVLAIRTDGTLWAWGQGAIGRLGNNSTASVSSPVQIGSDNDWAMVACQTATSIALKTNGTLWTWGDPTAGALGNNTNTPSKSSPTQIGALSDWAQVSAGNRCCIAIKTDGTLWVWGQNAVGNLGDGTLNSRSSPTQIGSLTNWAQTVEINSGSLTSGALSL